MIENNPHLKNQYWITTHYRPTTTKEINLYLKRFVDWNDKNLYFSSLARYGYLDALLWWTENYEKAGLIFTCSEYTMTCAALYGHTHILEWYFEHCKETNQSINWGKVAMISAAKTGQLNILDLYVDKKRLWNNDIIVEASDNCHVDILKWCDGYCAKKNILINCIDETILKASIVGNIEILEWWYQYCIKTKQDFRFPKNTIKRLAYINSIDIIIWWIDLYRSMKLTIDISCVMDCISCKGNSDSLNKWVDYCTKWDIPLLYSEKAMDIAASYNNINVLDWWSNFYQENGDYPKWSNIAMDEASCRGYTKVLDWFIEFCNNNICLPKWTNYALIVLYEHEGESLYWWKNYFNSLGKTLKCPDAVLKYIVKMKASWAIEWWLNNGVTLEQIDMYKKK